MVALYGIKLGVWSSGKRQRSCYRERVENAEGDIAGKSTKPTIISLSPSRLY